jgi:hypothetical protein
MTPDRMPRMEATATPAGPPKAGALARIGAVILALVLAFITAVAVIVMIDIGELTPCEDVTNPLTQLNDEGECFDGSSTSKTISLIVGWPGTILAGLAALMALGFAIRGTGGRQLVMVIIAAAVLLGLSLVIG